MLVMLLDRDGKTLLLVAKRMTIIMVTRKPKEAKGSKEKAELMEISIEGEEITSGIL